MSNRLAVCAVAFAAASLAVAGYTVVTRPSVPAAAHVAHSAVQATSTTRCATGSGPAVSCIRMPATSRRITGQQITDAPGVMGGWDTPWQVTDWTGAPMAWVNLFGLYSGGDGGKMPGGLVCVTYGTVATVACLTPTGDLTLQPTGPNGPYGPTQTLTPRDIRWIHAHGG